MCVKVEVAVRLYTYRYTVTTRMTPALRWAAMRAVFNVSLTVRDKVTRRCSQTTIFQEKGELKLIRTEVPLLDDEVMLNVLRCQLTH